MVNWRSLIEEEEKFQDNKVIIPEDDWRKEVAYSLCELYYSQYRAQRSYSTSQRIDLRPGSDFHVFMRSHMQPLETYSVWEALFPNQMSANSAGAIDEALHLLADTKLVDRVYSGDIVTVQKIVENIRKKRAKYLDVL
ncbi:MAG TPA: hypothetical protein VEL47_05265 [Myxococcota bacterium]|nr:hypothetical protein [Myxococcota bacterium]